MENHKNLKLSNPKSKKRYSTIIAAFIFMFVIPIIVYAALYFSNNRVNIFSPARANIKISENGTTAEETQENEPPVQEKNGDYIIKKEIVIVNDKTVFNKLPVDDQYIRVMLVPSWQKTEKRIIDEKQEDFVFSASGLPNGISDFRNYNLNKDERTLEVKNENDLIIFSFVLAVGWENEWVWNSSDNCFYHKGSLESGTPTSKLLESVIIAKNTYENCEGYQLKIDVLADAVQTYDVPRTVRGNWEVIN